MEQELADITAELEVFEDHDSYLQSRLAKANRGMAADAIGSFARGGETETWCIPSAWPRQRTFYFAKYRREGARQLAVEVCRRGNYFTNRWVETGSPSPFSYKDLDETYPDILEWITWLTEQPTDSPRCFLAGVGVRPGA